MDVKKQVNDFFTEALKILRQILLCAIRSPVVVVAVVLFLMAFFLSSRTDVFLSYDNLYNLFRSTSIYGVIAIGMTFVVLTGGIDLSVGSVVGLSGIIVTMLMKDGLPFGSGEGLPIGVSIAIAILIGTSVGVVNGAVIYWGRVPPFIATLGTMTVTRGVIKLISDAKMVTGLNDTFKNFALKSFLYLPNLFWVWLIVIIIAVFVLTQTVFGRNVYAIGSSRETARLSGISISANTIGVYATSAFLSGIAGIMLASRLASGIPNSGTGYELDAIAATVVGGTLLTGARGGVVGTVLGSILLATIRNGGVLLKINPFMLEVLIGSLIVISVVAQRGNKK